MKIILVIFLYITSSQCGVLKDLDKSEVSINLKEIQLTRVTDAFVIGNITLLNEILIDVTKDKESHNNYKNYTFAPGLHVWDIKFHVSESLDEVNRVNSIVEATAIKTGHLVGKNCTTRDNTTFICFFYVNVDEVQFQNNTLPVNQDNPETGNQTDVGSDNVNNCTAPITIDGKVQCAFATTDAFVGGCPAGRDRAPDNTCVEVFV